jgi:hypothetical protein
MILVAFCVNVREHLPRLYEDDLSCGLSRYWWIPTITHGMFFASIVRHLMINGLGTYLAFSASLNTPGLTTRSLPAVGRLGQSSPPPCVERMQTCAHSGSQTLHIYIEPRSRNCGPFALSMSQYLTSRLGCPNTVVASNAELRS